jgi:hypothetical protein
MPDDHSEVVPLLPIPNRTVKRLSADDSAGSRVKVGHRQALTAPESPASTGWAFCVAKHLISKDARTVFWLMGFQPQLEMVPAGSANCNRLIQDLRLVFLSPTGLPTSSGRRRQSEASDRV